MRVRVVWVAALLTVAVCAVCGADAIVSLASRCTRGRSASELRAVLAEALVVNEPVEASSVIECVALLRESTTGKPLLYGETLVLCTAAAQLARPDLCLQAIAELPMDAEGADPDAFVEGFQRSRRAQVFVFGALSARSVSREDDALVLLRRAVEASRAFRASLQNPAPTLLRVLEEIARVTWGAFARTGLLEHGVAALQFARAALDTFPNFSAGSLATQLAVRLHRLRTHDGVVPYAPPRFLKSLVLRALELAAEDSQRLALLQGLDCAFASEICEYEALILEDQERLEESANAYANGALVAFLHGNYTGAQALQQRAEELRNRVETAPSPFFVSVRARMVQLQGDHIIAEGVMRQARLLERLQAVSEVKMAVRDTQLATKLRDTKAVLHAALAHEANALTPFAQPSYWHSLKMFELRANVSKCNLCTPDEEASLTSPVCWAIQDGMMHESKEDLVARHAWMLAQDAQPGVCVFGMEHALPAAIALQNHPTARAFVFDQCVHQCAAHHASVLQAAFGAERVTSFCEKSLTSLAAHLRTVSESLGRRTFCDLVYVGRDWLLSAEFARLVAQHVNTAHHVLLVDEVGVTSASPDPQPVLVQRGVDWQRLLSSGVVRRGDCRSAPRDSLLCTARFADGELPAAAAGIPAM